MKRIILVLITLFNITVNAQNLEQLTRSREITEIRSNLNLDGIKDVQGKKQSNVDGSPYLFKTWNNLSKIIYEDKEFVVAEFNYNIYSERFEAKLSEDSVVIINPRNIEKIVINNRIFGRYLDPEFQRNSYFEEVAKVDDQLLLKKYTVKIKKGSLNPLTKEKLTNDALVQDEVFYLCDLKDNKLKKIKLKKSTVQSLFNKDHIETVKSYVKEQRLSYKDADDLKKIVNYYNSI
ncbi:hypothetical protein OE09_2348 [Flavobacteriaceae bacterium MAR_2010_72]|nr:hypothetical protein OE09_2348 [Flavobacteriaceae bacterium MAR_2010_72]TVZ58943.1 hypothetical protein NA63_1458 [Flavobacteriaceae bacterium MAR_2010_105]